MDSQPSEEVLGEALNFDQPAVSDNGTAPLEEVLLAPDVEEAEEVPSGEDDREPDAYTENMLQIAEQELLAELDALEAPTEQEAMFDELKVAPKRPIFSYRKILKACFEHFRRSGFPYWRVPIHIGMQELNELAQMDDDALRHTPLAYHVADTYHPHRFTVKVKGKRTPLESFERDVLLRLALALALRHGGKLGVNMPSPLNMVRGTQTASNFRPGFALHIYRKFMPSGEGLILDTSTGFGGRLLAAIAMPKAYYLGVDPNVQTHLGNQRMASDYGATDRVTLLNQPVEDVDVTPYYETADLAFTSPPYFAKEMYSDEPTQSWKRYPTADGWREGFLRPMLLAQFAILKPGATSVVNIAAVKIGGKKYDVDQWTRDEAECIGFEALPDLIFPLTSRLGAYQLDVPASEPVLIFRKPIEEGP